MDSGNSGSLQSSSAGDEEYDSRAAEASSLSAFFNTTNHVGGFNTPTPDDHQHYLEPLSLNYFDPLPSSSTSRLPNPNSFLNLDMIWSKNLRSDPNCTDLAAALISAASSSQTTPTIFPAAQVPQAAGKITPPPLGSVSGSSNDQVNNGGRSNNMARNPKKRSRASRRAPTTVLTTDTANFRAMVQEFTGIPSPPFTSSPFPRSRLDLFGGGAGTSLRSASAATHLDPKPPPYLLRPFPQKFQPQPLAPSFSTAAINLNSGTNSSSNGNANSSTSINYQRTLPSSSDHFGHQPQNLLNVAMQNPVLNFHPLLQVQQPPPSMLPNSAAILERGSSSLAIPSSNDNNNLKMGFLGEFGLSCPGQASANLAGEGGPQNIPRPPPLADTTLRRNNQADNVPSQPQQNWGDHGNFSSSSQTRVANG